MRRNATRLARAALAWIRADPRSSPARRMLYAMAVGGTGGPARVWADAIGAAGTVLLCTLIYARVVADATTTGNAVAGIFQITDAKDYWVCANQIIDDGETGQWCRRRPLYSLFLAGLAMAAGRNLELTLWLQAALFGACLFLFLRQTARSFGLVGAAFAGLAVLTYASVFVFGQTMSEVLGLMLGLLAAAILLSSAERKSFDLSLVGLAVFSAAQMVRPGAAFALPLLVLWSALLAAPKTLRSLFLLGAVAALVAAGPIAFNASVVAAIGGDPQASNGNFPQTLYGLSIGDEWSAILTDHPELVEETPENVAEVYRLSLDNIRAEPDVFIGALLRNLDVYLHTAWYAPLTRGSFYIFLLSVAAAAAASLRDQRARLLAATALGEALAAPLLSGDAPIRVWAASGALTQAALPAFLVAAAAVLALRLLKADDARSRAPAEGRRARGIVAAAGVTLALTLLPLTPLRLLVADGSALKTPACSGSLRQVVVDLGATNRINLSRDGTSSKHALDFRRVVEGMNDASWVKPGIAALPSGQFAGAVEIGPGVGSYVGFFAPLDLPLPQQGEAALCLDDGRFHKIADWPFYAVKSIHPLAQ